MNTKFTYKGRTVQLKRLTVLTDSAYRIWIDEEKHHSVWGRSYATKTAKQLIDAEEEKV